MDSLPKYTTTGVSEPRAILKVKTLDHGVLKARFQKEFEKSFKKKASQLKKEFNIYSYSAIITNGTKETCDIKDYSLSEKGGLKIVWKNKEDQAVAFIWMRGSGTEPVFRIMCDVKGDNPKMEKDLLQWETELLEQADSEA